MRRLPLLCGPRGCHQLAVVGETLLLHMFTKVRVTGILALAGRMTLISSRLVSPPLAPLGLRFRSSFPAYAIFVDLP